MFCGFVVLITVLDFSSLENVVIALVGYTGEPDAVPHVRLILAVGASGVLSAAPVRVFDEPFSHRCAGAMDEPCRNTNFLMTPLTGAIRSPAACSFLSLSGIV